MNKIQKFISTAKSPAVIAYEYGIPTGTAGTKGFGNPGEIQVILIDRDNFKTRNNPHIFLDGT